jgi:hypothetical protein
MNPQKLLNYALVANEISRRAQQQREEKQAMDSAVAEKIPEAVQALIDNERIYEHQSEKVADALQNPVSALELLRDVAAHRNPAEVSTIGAEVPGQTKTSSDKGNPYTGGSVASFDDLPSGQRFRELLLGSGT